MLTNIQEQACRIYKICLQCVYTMELDGPKGAGKTWRDILTDQTFNNELAIANLLFGTAAQESALRWERQRTPVWEGNVGGFTKWQLETASILQTLKDLQKNALRAGRATQFLFDDPRASQEWLKLPLDTILWMMRLNDNDAIGALFCREHYRRFPSRIPQTLEGQANYWKQLYNTSLGKGTPEQYIKSWQTYCVGVDKLL